MSEQSSDRSADENPHRETSPVPLPPAGFDPLKASDAELALYGLPPRPDEQLQPLLYKAFATVFSSPVTFVDPELELFIVETPVGPPPEILPAATRIVTSSNWSGASILANSGRMLVMIMGAWQVPDVEAPPGAGESARSFKCSAWIGLDGQRRYLNSSLPQIGVEQDVDPSTGAKTIKPWFQWFARGELASNRKYITGVPVAIGDEVACLLWVTGAQSVSAYFTNLTTQQSTPLIDMTSPDVRLADGTMVQPAISGATAEWIMERPTIPQTTTLEPFAAFTPITFSPCIAAMGPSSGAWVTGRDIQAPRLLRMFTECHDPDRTTFLAMPNAIDDLSFEVHYGDDFFRAA